MILNVKSADQFVITNLPAVLNKIGVSCFIRLTFSCRVYIRIIGTLPRNDEDRYSHNLRLALKYTFHWNWNGNQKRVYDRFRIPLVSFTNHQYFKNGSCVFSLYFQIRRKKVSQCKVVILHDFQYNLNETMGVR